MPSAAQELEAAASVLAGRALLARACRVLATVDIVPLVLKGVLLSALTEGSGAPPRPMIDVDILVPRDDHARATAVLAADGLEIVGRTSTATTLRDAGLGLDLDLHARLVEPELFHLDAVALFARSLEDRDLFGFSVRVPERKDLYAHLVAHFARGRSNARDRRRLGDFGIVARVLPMNASALAAHLHGLGLGRATRYALGLASQEGDPFARQVLEALPPDRVGAQVARAAGVWLSRFAGPSPLAVPALHALNTSLPRGAYSLLAHAGRGLRARTPRMLERPPERR